METQDRIATTKDWSNVSSQVSRTWYNIDTGEMKVLFKSKNALWVYSHVELPLWIEQLSTPSIGKFLNTKIKPNHAATKIS